MAKIRATLLLTSLLAMALLCGSLTGDSGGCGINADIGTGNRQAVHLEGPLNEAPGGFAGDGVPPEIVSPFAIVGKGERPTPATLDPSTTELSVRLAAAASGVAQATPPVSSTPLYLSHCAFLC